MGRGRVKGQIQAAVALHGSRRPRRLPLNNGPYTLTLSAAERQGLLAVLQARLATTPGPLDAPYWHDELQCFHDKVLAAPAGFPCELMYNEWRHWLSDNSDLPSLLTKEQETALISKFWELSRERASAKHLNADELALLAAVADLSREGVRATAVRVAEHIAGRTLNDHRPHGSEDSLLARGTPSKLSHLANDRDLLRYAGLEVGEKAQFELTPLGRKRLASRR